VLALIFLTRNGIKLAFDKTEAIRTFLALAAGELSEDELADWFRQRVVAA
jgi:death on curing protein